MARQDDPKNLIVQQNGRKIFIKTIAMTSSASTTAIGTTCADGTPIPPGALLCLQGDQDFYYRPVITGASPGATATNSVRILQYQQEFVHVLSSNSGGASVLAGDGALDVLCAAASGNLQVFLVT